MDLHIKRTCQKHVVMITLGVLLAVLILYAEILPKSDQIEEDEPELVPPNPTIRLPPSGARMQIFKNAAVAADAGTCAQVGRDVLRKGGSAVDAAIAALICNSVVNMQSAGLGGGFFMTVFKQNENKAYCLNARERAPLKATMDMFKKNNATSNGSLAVAVPGEIKGYLRAHEKFGILPWQDLVQPSINICKDGYVIGEHQYASSFKNNLHTNDENIREWFFEEDGSFKKPGNRVFPTKLCEFLEKLSENGPEDFYTGNLSTLFLKDMEEADAIITADDLQSYDAEWQQPVEVTLKDGNRLYTFPAPGSGPVLAFILNVLDGYNLTASSVCGIENQAKTYHRIVETFKYAHAKRTDLADPKFVDVKRVIEQLTSKEFAEQIRLKINDCKTNSDPTYYGAHYFPKDDHGTSHISVLAENGDAVSVTSTVNIYFGAGMTSKRTGIILNSAMDDFSYPNFVNYFSISGSPANKMEPGKVPFSSMAPTILTDNFGNVKVVAGGAGGPKITTAIAETLTRLLWYGNNLKEAIDGPRLHHQLFPMKLQYEYGVLESVIQELESMGHKTQRRTAESIVYALKKDKDSIIGIADIRKPGGGVFGF